MAQEFNCPQCGAPLDVPGGEAATMHCPFCNTEVVIPPEMRAPQTIKIPIVMPAPAPNPNWQLPSVLPWLILPLAIVVFVVFALNMTMQTFNAAFSSNRVIATVAALSTTAPRPSPTQIPSPTATPTPAFAHPVLSFGSPGTGPGQFNRSLHLALDGNGHIYVADADGGRIQQFDLKGKYLDQWTLGQSTSHTHGLAVDRHGILYAVIDNQIERLDTQIRKSLGAFKYSGGNGFDWVTTTPDGNILAMWYDIQNGLVTDRNGHMDDLVRFDPNGKVLQTIPSLVGKQTGEFSYDVRLAVDGQGTIYALDRVGGESVFVYSREGKFITRIGSRGNKPGQLQSPIAVAVDGARRVYVSDSHGIQVFDGNGTYIDTFGGDGTVWDIAVDDANTLYAMGSDKLTEYAVTAK
ncbi:MAG: hypothetical protein WCF84_11725 [Anaerolineae bacterium]